MFVHSPWAGGGGEACCAGVLPRSTRRSDCRTCVIAAAAWPDASMDGRVLPRIFCVCGWEHLFATSHDAQGEQRTRLAWHGALVLAHGVKSEPAGLSVAPCHTQHHVGRSSALVGDIRQLLSMVHACVHLWNASTTLHAAVPTSSADRACCPSEPVAPNRPRAAADAGELRAAASAAASILPTVLHCDMYKLAEMAVQGCVALE